MESRISEPELNIPKEILISGSGDSFTVKWSAETGVTGYEVAISAIDKNGKTYNERTYKAGVNQIKIESFTGGVKDKVTPLWTYYIRIRSLNGSWSSPYSDKVTHYQPSAKAPDAPYNVKINGKFRQLDVSWKDMPGTEKYTLEYREYGTEEYTVVNDITKNAYQITDLKDDTAYQVRVFGWNTDQNGNLRSGPYSLPAVGKTTVEIPKFPKYGMVTRDQISSVSCFATQAPGGPGGFDSTQYDSEGFKNEYVIDGDYTTYMHTNKGYPHGVIVDFKEEVEIKEVLMTTRLEDAYRDGTGYSQVIFEYWDADGNKKSVNRSSIAVASLHPTSKNTMKFTLAEPVKAKKVRFGLSKYGAGVVTISEINFFKYDSLEDDVNALYGDEMHVTLNENVTEEMIAALEARAQVKDPNFDEYHPKKDLLESELAYARELLVNKDNISSTIKVKSDITKSNTNNCGFSGGISGYQPLGYVAESGSKVNIYVGQKNKKVGDVTAVRLVFTQYHPESSAWNAGEITLHQGKNEITIPEVSSLDFEKGGSLYIVHTNPTGIDREPVEVRVSGATKIPMLDLHRTIGNDRFEVNEEAWKSTIRTYVENLVDYTSKLEAMHEAQETEYAYGNGSNCFLNSTEISLDNVLISVPASQILAGLGGASLGIETLTNKLYDSLVAMNQMIELFYKERGFNPALSNGYQGIPTARFNIRYHRMFAGAFMYAGGLHLGIEWDSVPALAGGSQIVTDDNGKMISGSTFGWGIAHEMGHNADPGGVTYPTLVFSSAGSNIKSYPATSIRITAQNRNIGIKDIRLLSPAGDNVDIGVSTVDEITGVETWNTENAIGILKDDYILDEVSGDKIPAGSFVVTGKYTGNPGYNVIKLYNEKHVMYDSSVENKLGSIINGYQTFFADVPEAGSITNVRDGFWVYYLEPLSGENAGKFGLPGAAADGSDVVVELPTKVYAELYRVDDKNTLANERLVSDSFTVSVPQVLPQIVLQNAA